MDEIDNKIRRIIKNKIELSEKYTNTVNDTLQDCFKERIEENNKNAKRKNLVSNVIKKIMIATAIGASTITVYAVTSNRLPFEEMGFIKLGENYEESAFNVNETLENDYFKITLESMAGDDSYIIANYRIKVKELFTKEFGNIEYRETSGYKISLWNNVFLNSKEIKERDAKVTKISEDEYVYTEVMNIMNNKDEKMNVKIYIDNVYINYLNKIKVGKVIEVNMNLKKEANKSIINEYIIDENNKIEVNNIGNTKFETYITLKKVTENVTYKEYKSKNFIYDSFTLIGEKGENIPYTVFLDDNESRSLYKKNGNNQYELTDRKSLEENDIIKYVENFIILIGNQNDIKSVKVIPIETKILNDRTNEEKIEYKNTKWYPLVAGNKKYSAQSSLGGNFEIQKIKINDSNVEFYYEENGLIGNEQLIVIRKNNGIMNYIFPTRIEKKGVNSSENKIIFSADMDGVGGLNTFQLDDMFDDIDNIEFALLYGSNSKILREAFILEIPKQNNNVATFERAIVKDSEQIILKGTLPNFIFEHIEYKICYDDNQILLIEGEVPLSELIDIDSYTGVEDIVNALKDYCISHNGTCEIE